MAKDRDGTISKRQMEVAVMLAMGWENRRIGRELGISPHTVSSHRDRVLDQLNLRNNVDIARYAIAKGWVPAPVVLCGVKDCSLGPDHTGGHMDSQGKYLPVAYPLDVDRLEKVA